MKNQMVSASGCFFILILAFAAACSSNRFAGSNRLASEEPLGKHPQSNNPTKITKDVLRERLKGKSVDFIETPPPCDEPTMGGNSDVPEPVIKKAVGFPCDKPNPLWLRIKIIKSYKDSFKAQLNVFEEYDLDGLTSKLNSIFKDRETNGVYREDTNEVEKGIRLAASDGDIADYERNDISVEDFERLIDDLHKAGIDQISVDFTEFLPSKTAPKTISRGILNEKAVQLVQPSYPPAAKAVKASGQVTVQATIDENGDVVSAEAVSGHPLLRSAAVQAARSSKFAVTKLGGQPVKVTGIIVYKFTVPE
jgi:TonB family protein